MKCQKAMIVISSAQVIIINNMRNSQIARTYLHLPKVDAGKRYLFILLTANDTQITMNIN